MSERRFGVELYEYLDAPTVLEEVQLAEELGFDAVWLGDSQLIWRELYVLLGAAAATTARVALGVGVTNPLTRHPAVTASAIATAQELSHGRAILGVGVGDSAVRTLGIPSASRADLARFVETVRSLTGGETVQGAAGELRLAFGSERTRPPIVIGASGPKMLRLAGEIGDGVIVTRQARPGERLQAMLSCVREGRAASAGPDRPFVVCLSAAAAVHGDRQKAIAAVRPHAARSLLTPLWRLDADAQRASERVRAAYDYAEHMNPGAAHAEAIPDAVVAQYVIAGRPEECVEQVGSLFAAGVDEITIRPYGVDGGSRRAMLETFAREVMRPYRARAAPVR